MSGESYHSNSRILGFPTLIPMTLKTRRILYLSCILIFALTAPPLVLYTTGFRYDWEYRRLVETGSLVVKSNPEGAAIYLNGQLYQDATPTIINNILPGKINLEVKKDGYHAWQKNLAVNPRLTTFVENIKLFLRSETQTYLPALVADYWWNGKQDKLVYATGKELRLYNTLNQKNSLITKTGRHQNAAILWSPHDDRFVFNQFIIDAASPEKFIDLKTIAPEALKNIQWDPLAPGTIYSLTSRGLYRISYLIKTARLVKAGNIINYSLKGDKIILLQKSALGTSLVYFTLSDPSTMILLGERPDAANDIFLETNSHRLAIYNHRQKSLTIFDPSLKATNPELATIEIPDVDKAIWSRDGGRLVYASGGAIYQRSFTGPITVIPAPKTTELITRYSQSVADVFWSDDENYLFYFVADSLRVLEITPSTAPHSLILLANLTQAKKAGYIFNPAAITFIDKEGSLKLLPLAEAQTGTFFFGR